MIHSPHVDRLNFQGGHGQPQIPRLISLLAARKLDVFIGKRKASESSVFLASLGTGNAVLIGFYRSRAETSTEEGSMRGWGERLLVLDPQS
jgi:hypothetical protein